VDVLIGRIGAGAPLSFVADPLGGVAVLAASNVTPLPRTGVPSKLSGPPAAQQIE
jgi:hypothetical protein